MRREDTGSHAEADAGRFERDHAADEPRDREYAEPWPPAWFDADQRAESDALWGGAEGVYPCADCGKQLPSPEARLLHAVYTKCYGVAS